jgi:hypothetical protein
MPMVTRGVGVKEGFLTVMAVGIRLARPKEMPVVTATWGWWC